MLRSSLPITLGLVALALTFGTSAAAQGCVTGTFWKRDTLPDIPTGLTTVGVIRGMCEGESAGVVFEMPATMGAQRITRVVAPWGHAPGGTNGFQAALDVEIYDGVSFSGASVNMGTLVFSLTSQPASNMLVQTHGLNAFDMTPYSAIVGVAPPTAPGNVRRFAVCFRCDVNSFPSTCAAGYNANFFTDAAPLLSLTCDPLVTPPGRCVMEILGQGWRDPALTTVPGPFGPVQICPLYYRGIWCIRACTEDAFPSFYTPFGPGCPNSIGTSGLLNAALPRIGQTLIVNITNVPSQLGLMITGTSNVVSPLGPLPLDLTPIGMPGCMLRTSLDATDTLLTAGTTASYTLGIPNQVTLLGLRLYHQAFVFDPPLNAFGGAMSNAAEWQIGN